MAVERLPRPAPTLRSSLTGGIAPQAPEIPPASIETNPSDTEHHLDWLPGRIFDVPCQEVSPAGSRGTLGTRRRERSTCRPHLFVLQPHSRCLVSPLRGLSSS